jgi:predicted O-methyltransferase YrrM
MPNFTSDWFSHHISVWIGFFASLRWDAEAPKTVIEIGSYEGRASLWMLENLLKNKESVLHCVDVFAEKDGADSYWRRFKSNIEGASGSKKVSVHSLTSFEFLIEFISKGRRADFIYVDGSHRAADVLEDLVLSFRSLKPGGILICDDYLGGAGKGNDLTLGSPKIAVDTFTTIFRDRIEIIGGQPLYQLAFIKHLDRADDDPTSRGQSAV